MKRLVVIGAGGTGKDVVGWRDELNVHRPRYECIGFLDDDAAMQGRTIAAAQVLGPLARAVDFDDVSFVDTLGSPRSFRARKRLVTGLGIPAERFETIVHPRAIVSPSAELGRGCVVYPQAVIGAEARLGDHVVVLANVVINHDCEIGSYSIAATSAAISGGVRVGTSVYLGAGCTIRDALSVGNGALIGMGAVVVRDVAEGAIVAGNPARQLDC